MTKNYRDVSIKSAIRGSAHFTLGRVRDFTLRSGGQCSTFKLQHAPAKVCGSQQAINALFQILQTKLRQQNISPKEDGHMNKPQQFRAVPFVMHGRQICLTVLL